MGCEWRKCKPCNFAFDFRMQTGSSVADYFGKGQDVLSGWESE